MAGVARSHTFLALLLASLASSQAQELQKEADNPLNCPRIERARKGDRVLIRYKGLLATGDTFDQGEADFVLGENKVIAGWEEGFTGQCAGEKITMIVPPSLGYGDQASDKVEDIATMADFGKYLVGQVPANSTLYFLTTLDGIVRVTKAKVSQPDGRGKIFFDKPSFELRFGKPNAKTLVLGLERTVTGTCTDEKRLLLLGPSLAYGSTGNRNGSVPPNSTVHVEVEVVRVRNKKPDSDIGLGFLERLAAGTARLPNGR